MNKTTQSVTDDFLKNLSTRNLENLTQLFSERVNWFIPGDESKAPWLGKRNNRQDINEFYQLLWSQTEPVSAEVDTIFVKEEKVAITGEFSTKMLQTGKMVNSLFCIQMSVENGLITQYTLLEDSYAVSESLKR